MIATVNNKRLIVFTFSFNYYLTKKRETRLILVRNSWPSTALPVDEQIEFHAESYNYPKSVPLGYKNPRHTTGVADTTYP